MVDTQQPWMRGDNEWLAMSVDNPGYLLLGRPTAALRLCMHNGRPRGGLVYMEWLLGYTPSQLAHTASGRS